MKMIKYSIGKITIKNFRGIRELSVEFKADRPAILVGPNNAGKSSFLDAFGLAMCSPKFLNLRGFNLVAGGGFEPPTFGL